MTSIQIIGHRGYGADTLQGEVPENTIPSFVKALEAGANGIELDVFKTQDGALVVFGNKEVNGRLIGEQTLEEVQTFRTWNGEPIPVFEDVLDAVTSVNPTAIINVELKGPSVVDEALDAITKRIENGSLQWEQFLFSAFDWDKLRLVKERVPDAKVQPTTATVFIFDQQDVQMPGYHVPVSISYNAAALNEVRKVSELQKAHAIDVPTFDIREEMLHMAAELGCGFCTHPTGPSRSEDIAIFTSKLQMLAEFARDTGLPVYLKVDDIPLAVELARKLNAGEDISIDPADLYSLTGQPCDVMEPYK